MKTKYEELEMEIILIEDEDIITSSTCPNEIPDIDPIG